VISPRRGPGVPARALNGIVALAVGRLGLPLPRLRMLRVHGRRTGRLRSTPVLVLHRRGARYLVAPRGRTDWAANLRAAGWGELIRGRRIERVRATEVRGEERAAAVGAYVRRFGWLTGRFFGLPRRFGPDDVRRIAPRHPTFRLGAMLLLTLALAGPAAAARPAYVIPPQSMPLDAREARATLRAALATAPAGSRTRADIEYVLRLDRAHLLRRGQPAGRRSTVSRTLRVNAWWYASHGAPSSRIIVSDPEGVLSTYWEGRGLAVNPVATAGRWQRLNAGHSPEELADALLPFGVARRAGARRFTLWEYYDVPDRPGVVRPGASGMAQGRIAQLMARAYHRTGDARFARAAAGALAAFTVPVARGGVVSRVAARGGRGRSPWYVERAYPGASPWKGAALNGFMVTLLNLDATVPFLTSRPEPLRTGPRELRARPRAPGAVAAGRLARALAGRGERTLARYLPLHDTGSWSIYGLLTPGWPWRTHLADAGYHCYHVTLLRQLARQAPGRGFGVVAERWGSYARRAGVTCSERAAKQ
jgi:deazaflavin-dependent oxidoreductase (nitroreductase family)